MIRQSLPPTTLRREGEGWDDAAGAALANGLFNDASLGVRIHDVRIGDRAGLPASNSPDRNNDDSRSQGERIPARRRKDSGHKRRKEPELHMGTDERRPDAR